jgi:RHS repeat-associated protein
MFKLRKTFENWIVRPAAVLSMGMFLAVCEPSRGADPLLARPLAAGVASSIAVMGDGTVLAWGHNQNGELGAWSKGLSLDIPYPMSIAQVSNITSAAAGGYVDSLSVYNAHTLLLRNDGKVLACGKNQWGQLGNGNQVDRQTFSTVTNLSDVVAIAAGGYHSIALRADGTVWTWGANGSGELGNNSTAQFSAAPVQVTNLSNVIEITAGLYHSLALKSDGTVWGWGYNANGELGNGNAINQKVPVQVANLTAVRSICAGRLYSLALKYDGTVWAWGANTYGQMGNGTTSATQLKPGQVTNLTSVTAIAAGASHCLALLSDSTVSSWGLNTHGQVGCGLTASPQTKPVRVKNLSGVLGIAGGGTHSLALLRDSSVSAWGENTWGQVGSSVKTGTSINSTCLPVNLSLTLQLTMTTNLVTHYDNHNCTDPVTGAFIYCCADVFGNPIPCDPYTTTNITINSVQAPITNSSAVQNFGNFQSVMAQANGTVWRWGYNSYAQLGNVGAVSHDTPEPISGLTDVVETSLGGTHCLALKRDGTVWASGANLFGQLGTGSQISSLFAQQSINLPAMHHISAGDQHSLALDTNGQVWAWGYNGYGQLGIGSVSNVLVGTNISLTGISQIAAGANHSLALRTNGTIVGWGYNAYGQIGDGTYTNRANGVPVTNLSSVAAITCGDRHSLALDTNGQVFAWGNNSSGQLGNTNMQNQPVPQLVAGLPVISTIGAGIQFSVALASNGTVWEWGYNWSGQLGDGTRVSRSVPAQVQGLTNVISISVFSDHVIATLSDYSVRAWGANQFGQLGNNSIQNESVPVAIPGFYIVQPAYLPFTSSPFATVTARYRRGSGNDQTYQSFVIPLDFEAGMKLDDLGDNTNYFGGRRPWFTSISKDTLHHLSAASIVTNIDGSQISNYRWTLDFQNPIVAFGSAGSASSLTIDRSYRFGIYSGSQFESANSDGQNYVAPIRILVYRRSDFANGATNVVPCATNLINVPRPSIAAESNAWTQFLTNGLTLTVETNGLRTTLELVEDTSFVALTKNAGSLSTNAIVCTNAAPGSTWSEPAEGSTNQSTTNLLQTVLTFNAPPSIGPWGVKHSFTNVRNGPFILTHRALSPDFYYVIEARGVVPSGTNCAVMVMGDSNTNGDWCRMYTLDFDNPQPWRSLFVSSPQFNGQPLPPSYIGKTPAELTQFQSVVTNVVSLTGALFTNLDGSPELRRHTLLDKFVADMNYDPIALANYVQNEIELTDPLSYNETSGQASAPTVTQDGINRGALGVFLEGQGSPMEQCSLLVYLLRQAGCPSAFVFPTNNNIQMLDTRLSTLLRMQLHGAVDYRGTQYTSNTLITVNYPWVVAKIGTNCIHFFPWIKDTEMIEGMDLYNYLPTAYDNGTKWFRNYLFGDPAIMAMDFSGVNTPSVLFPKFIWANLLENYPGVSLDDIGMKVRNRRHLYSRWQDFPSPTVVTNADQVVVADSLTSSTITNVSPLMTNIFNTVDIQVYSIANTNHLIDTGEMRMSDLHNRKFLILTNGVNLQLWLAAFQPGVTNQTAFSNDAALTNVQILSLPLTYGPTFGITVTHHRHKAINPSSISTTNNYLGVFEQLVSSQNDRWVQTNELTAICLNVGRVSGRMIDVYAKQYWQMQQQLKTNKTVTPALQDVHGTATYLMGMDYFRNVDEFKATDERLHKAHVLSWNAEGLCKLSFKKIGTNTLASPTLDIYLNEIATAGNGTMHPDSGDAMADGVKNFSMLLMAEMGAQEHRLLDGYYLNTNAISAVQLLQWAQQHSSGATNGIVELTRQNYAATGNSSSLGYGATLLKNFDTNFWSRITNAFSGANADYTVAYVTPAPIANPTGKLKKMAAIILAANQSAFLVGANLNDGEDDAGENFGDDVPGLSVTLGFNSDLPPGYHWTTAHFWDDGGTYHALSDQEYTSLFMIGLNGRAPISSGSYNIIDEPCVVDQWGDVVYAPMVPGYNDGDVAAALFGNSASSAMSISANTIDNMESDTGDSLYQGDTFSWTPSVSESLSSVIPSTSTWFDDNTSELNSISTPAMEDAWSRMAPIVSTENINDSGTFRLFQMQNGDLAPSVYNLQLNNSVSDPVSPITGAFVVDTVDIVLPGPFPLTVRRNYSSQNVSDQNGFGYGWKINYVPYLEITTNKMHAPTNVVLYAAEEDGSVIAYRRQLTDTNLYLPALDDNPTLVNNTTGGVGSTANMFNSKILRSQSGTNIFYTLSAPDGSSRVFQMMSFAVSTATNVIHRVRPYLTKWSDNCGNSRQFTYGMDSATPDYGQLIRIRCSNGNFIGFYYNVYTYVSEVYTADGRRITYNYNNFGDLVSVTLPDQSQITYDYHLYNFATNGVSHLDSDHLLTRETKPGGRILQNLYDEQRRVQMQSATVGPDLDLYRNAVFTYSNNFVFTNSATNFTSGYTLIRDVNNQTTRYDYVSNMITVITDPLRRTNSQTWYFTNDVSGGYQRSVSSITDNRGLVNKCLYDSNGNLTNRVISGVDLTGEPTAPTNAVFNYTYINNILASQIDPLGNLTVYQFGNTNYPFLPTQVEFYASNGIAIRTNVLFYSNCFTLVTNGPLVFTNSAYGMLTRSIAAVGTGDAATNDSVFDGRGFVTCQIAYTGTGDPNVTNYFSYDERGYLVQKTNPDGSAVITTYDPMGRLTGKEVYDQNSTVPASTEYYYYNENGELNWYDGPRSNPEDYVWYDYDGAGRKIQEIRWRSRAKADGSGVEAETGDNLYATTFFEYDMFGNQTAVKDQYGNVARMGYDAVNQLTSKAVYPTNSSQPIRVEGWAYESGGNVSVYTNALGGVTSRYYTTTGQLEKQINPDGSTQQWRYDLLGRVVREYLVNGNYWQITYNDANRSQTKTFSADAGYLETKVFDRRGNLVVLTNCEGGVFLTSYDGLNRVKQKLGPPGANQQVSIYGYDSSGRKLVVTNALGEIASTAFDVLGRTVTNAVYDSSYSLVSLNSTAYSSDLNSVRTTLGSGANAITTVVFTDTLGKNVLTLKSPSPGVTNYSKITYDIMGNLVCSQDELGQKTIFAYDALNRLATQTLPDTSTTSFAYNAAGTLTSRAMPGGLTWSAVYDNANRIVSEQLGGGTLVNRRFTNSYTTNGLLVSKVDLGRGVTQTFAYDSYLRMKTNVTSGAQTDQNLSISYQYDRRGLVTNVIQRGATTTNVVARAFDTYQQITEELVSIDNRNLSDFHQNWDSASRRIELFQPNAGSAGSISDAYRADGLMTNVIQGGFSFNFSYGNNGLLTSRANPWRSLVINSRDGQGRMLQETATVGVSNVFQETMTWRPNSTLASYAATRIGVAAWNENNSFRYNIRNQVINEPVGISTGSSAAYGYSFDTNKMGVLVGAQLSGALSNNWSGSLNSLDQLSAESWHQDGLKLRASGFVVDSSAVTATLDTHSVSNVVVQDGRWYSDLDLSVGLHKLTATASYNSGQFTKTVTNNFNVLGTNSTVDSYDGCGNLTNRVFADGRTQSLVWDGLGRLVGVTQRDISGTGLNWAAIYDGFGRRVRTTTIPVITNVLNSAQILTIDSYYDPQVEFQELAVDVNGQRTWKIMGPDLTGSYGGLNGVGALEATVHESDGIVIPVLNDRYGNVLATISSGQVSWTSIRVGGYGPMNGYRVPSLTLNTPLVETLVWRSRRADPTGFYYMGNRPYDSFSQRFISPDPAGHNSSSDLYSAFQGDPVNYFDPDGLAPYAFNPMDSSTWIVPKTGTWSGAIGNSMWTPPSGTPAFQQTGGKPIEWVNGTPNFKPFAESMTINGVQVPATATIKATGDPVADRGETLRELSSKTGLTQEQITDGLRDNELRVHHYYDGEMQIVSADLNAIPHSGVASGLRAGTIEVSELVGRGVGKALVGVGVVGLLTDPVGVLAGPTSTMGDATVTGYNYRMRVMHDRAAEIVANPTGVDTDTLQWALSVAAPGMMLGANNDISNLALYAKWLSGNNFSESTANSLPASINVASPNNAMTGQILSKH